MNLDLYKVHGINYILRVVLKNYEFGLSYILPELFQYVAERLLFSRLLEGLIGGPCI